MHPSIILNQISVIKYSISAVIKPSLLPLFWYEHQPKENDFLLHFLKLGDKSVDHIVVQLWRNKIYLTKILFDGECDVKNVHRIKCLT